MAVPLVVGRKSVVMHCVSGWGPMAVPRSWGMDGDLQLLLGVAHRTHHPCDNSIERLLLFFFTFCVGSYWQWLDRC